MSKTVKKAPVGRPTGVPKKPINLYILEAGKAYLVNTKRTHSTNNKGDSDRIHLMFKVPIGHVNKIIHSTYNLLNISQ